jgi:hypothetical protein
MKAAPTVEGRLDAAARADDGHDLPKAPARPISRGIPAQALAARIDSFLASRGYVPDAGKDLPPRPAPEAPRPPAPDRAAPEEFICEDDVRTAIKAGRKLVIGDRTIVTPAARELGEEKKVFIDASVRL